MEQSMEPPSEMTADEIPTESSESSEPFVPSLVVARAEESRDAVFRAVPDQEADDLIDELATDELAEELAGELAGEAVEAPIEMAVIEEIDVVLAEELATGGAAEDEVAADQSIGQSYETMLAAAEKVLDEVDEALARLRNASYGTCEVCGDGIADDHLAAWPTARTCERHLQLADQTTPA